MSLGKVGAKFVSVQQLTTFTGYSKEGKLSRGKTVFTMEVKALPSTFKGKARSKYFLLSPILLLFILNKSLLDSKIIASA